MSIVCKFLNGQSMDIMSANPLTVDIVKGIMKRNVEGEISVIYKGEILADDIDVTKLPGIADSFLIIHNKRKILPRPRWDFNDSGFLPSRLLRREMEPPKDPDNFNELVTTLSELGFERDKCERALRISGYILNRAASLLVSGSAQIAREQEIDRESFEFYNHREESQQYAPSSQTFELPDRPNVVIKEIVTKSDDEDEEDRNEEEEDMSDYYSSRSSSSSSESTSDDIENPESQENQETQQHRPEIAQNIISELNSFANIVMNLPENDRRKISQLKQMSGVDIRTAAQIYLACNRNLALSLECILGSH